MSLATSCQLLYFFFSTLASTFPILHTNKILQRIRKNENILFITLHLPKTIYDKDNTYQKDMKKLSTNYIN
jgi:hypothetical protein